MFQEVLICDDHAFCRMGLEVALRAANPQVRRLHLVGSAEAALEVLRSDQPDLACIDLGLPGMSGLELIRALKLARPDLPVIVVTACDLPETLRQLLKLGVAAILQKESGGGELRKILASMVSLPRETILDARAKEILRESPPPDLTPREFEVMELVVQGLSNRQIADRFDCAVSTIRFHRANVMEKIDVRNAAELTAWYLQGQRKGH